MRHRRSLPPAATTALTFLVGVASTQTRPAPSPTSPPGGVAARAVVVAAAPPKAEADFDGYGSAVGGLYTNDVYGFSVEVPEGMLGFTATAPAPDHGFGVDLDRPRSCGWMRPSEGFPKSYLYVDGSYNSGDAETLDELARHVLGYVKTDEGTSVKVVGRRRTRLGGLPAVRLVVEYTADGVRVVDDTVLAFRNGEGGDVVYTVGLTAPAASYDEHRRVLDSARQTFRLRPLE
jgi:hypothetical protein